MSGQPETKISARDGLAFASPGRLLGHVAADRDLFDMFEFQRAASDLLGAEIRVYSDGRWPMIMSAPTWPPPARCEPGRPP